jgi:hypothetical protein
MRRTSAALLIAGLLFTAACGGDDDEPEGDAGAESAEGTEGGGEGAEGAEGGGEGGGSSSEFCAAYEGLGTTTDPEALATEFANLEPPAEIADAWQVMTDTGGDPSSPEAMEAAQEVGTYVMEECMGGELPQMPEGEPPTDGN